MRISELTQNPEVLDEGSAPAGLMTQMGRKIAGKLGSIKNKASANVGDRANQLYKEFTTYATQSGIDLKRVPKTEVQAWFQKQGLPFPQGAERITAFNLTHPEMSKIFWTRAAQQSFKATPLQTPSLGQQYGLSGAATRPTTTTATTFTPTTTTRTTSTSTPSSSTGNYQAEYRNLLQLVNSIPDKKIRGQVRSSLDRFINAAFE